MEVVIGLTDGFVHASAVVVLTFASVKWNTVLPSGVLILLDCVCLS